MKYTEQRINEIFENAKRYKIQQKRLEWISVLNLLNQKENIENILEIGACNGGTTFTLSHFCKTLTTIDHLNPSLFSFDEIGNNCQYRYFGMSSHEEKTFNMVADKKYDVIFIDGDHTYEGCKQDYIKYSTLLSENGMVIFHDIIDSDMHRRHNCTVAKFWDELRVEVKCKSIYEFCFECGTDLEYARTYITQDINCREWGGVGVIQF